MHNKKNLIVLVDESKSPVKIHFATDDFELLLRIFDQFDGETQINFVPHGFKEQLESIGFFTWGEYVDFFNKNLAKTYIECKSYYDIEFLKKNECNVASSVSKSCAGKSRGFTGETKEWFFDWIDENDVIIVRENNVIVGFCCVAIYNNGTTLWIREIAVHPKFQGAGLGKKLLEQAICYGINKSAVRGFLAADVQNDNAIEMYKKYGFIPKYEESELQMRRYGK